MTPSILDFGVEEEPKAEKKKKTKAIPKSKGAMCMCNHGEYEHDEEGCTVIREDGLCPCPRFKAKG